MSNTNHRITVGSTWHGRGLKVRVLRVGLCIVLVERLDLKFYRVHPWQVDDFDGMSRG